MIMDQSRGIFYVWDDVLTIINGRNQKAVECENGIYPIYGSGGVMGQANDYLCPENTVIIGRKGNINKPIFVETKFWNVDTAFGLVAKQEYLNPKYLYYFCSYFDFERLNKAVTIPSLTKADLLKIEMCLPGLNVQSRIVAELDKINEIISQKKEQIMDLDKLAQSLFYEMFGDPVENEKGWEVKTWNESLSIINGRNQKAVENPEGPYPIYGSGGIMSYATEYLCPEDSVIIGRKGNIDKPLLVRTKFWNVDTAFGLVPNTELLHSHYLYFYCKVFDFQRLNKAVTIPSLTKADLLKIQMALPPLALQHSFAAKIEAIEAHKTAVQASKADLQTLLDARMQEYFG